MFFSKFTFILPLLAIIFSGCTEVSQNTSEVKYVNNRPTNIILMIGDGMGLSQISFAMMSEDIPLKKDALNMERFQHIGLMKTYSAKEKVTDSGAGATAFSIGKKSYNGAIGVDRDGVNQETILEYLESKGYSSGVVATSSITHATPAAFYAHCKNRQLEEDIAIDLLNSSLDFFAGGGLQYFTKRRDGKNIVEELTNKGWEIDTTALNNKTGKRPKGFLLAAEGMPRMSEGRKDFLPKASSLAITHLSSNENGFFLLIEGSQIDWAGHKNESDYLLEEVLDFDAAIGNVLDYAEKDGNTLVIVTADHETGGLALNSKEGDYSQIEPKFTSKGHTAALVPVFTYGPGADELVGVYENTEIYHRIKKLLK